MNKRLVLILICLLFSVSLVCAQKTRKKPTPKLTEYPNIEFGFEPIPEIKDFAFVISIDKDEKATMTVQKSEDLDTLDAGQLKRFFMDFLRLQNTKNPAQFKELLDPIVIIRPDPSLTFESVVKIIQATRVSYNSKIKLEIAQGLYLAVPKLIKPHVDFKPNPLALIVGLNEEKGITLNNEKYGNLSDLAPLTKKLKDIFQERENNGAWREGTNEVEKTVYVKMPQSAKFADLIIIAKALEDAGAAPIGLQVDDLDAAPIVDSRRKLIGQ